MQSEMSEADRRLIADAVLRDGRLPAEMRDLLFPDSRSEATLTYGLKGRKEDVIAQAMAVPLQAIREFGGQGGDTWRNALVFGDNLQALKTLLQQKERGELRNAAGEPGVQLIYIDPPFASSRDFGARQGEIAYQDKVVGAEFLEFLRRRLILLHELMSKTGSIFVHLDSKKGHYVKVLMDEIFGEQNFRNEIVWHYYNKMQGNINRFASDHDVIYWYTKTANYTFNTQREVRADGPVKQIKRAWDPQTKKLVNAKGPDGKVTYQTSEEKTVDDVWRLSMLQPADRTQNLNYPTQKPESIAGRIINAASNEGDIVLDAFAGSGTAVAVAEKLNRRWIGIDCGKLAIYTIQKRLLTLRDQVGNRGRQISPKPFVLYNAGLYDFGSLSSLPWVDWRFFALRLFECEDSPHRVSGVDFDGFRIGSDVLVFDHRLDGGVVLDHGFIRSLHESVGRRVSDSVFIIAPAASVAFLEDYLDLDDTRYYVMRIPYSIINELHARPFEAIQQPLRELDVNRTVDSVGFDFMKQPRVRCRYSLIGPRASGKLRIEIDEFKSEALARGVAARGNRETLAAVLIDTNYVSNVGNGTATPFVLDHMFYAEELEAKGWAFEIDRDVAGEYLMIVYLDIYGNEYTEVKSFDDFVRRSTAKGTATSTAKKATVAKRATVAKKATVVSRTRPKSSASAKSRGRS